MARLLCDICGVRPATVRLAVLQNGQRQVLDVCDFHYAQITRHQRSISPLEALFRAQASGGQAPPDESQQPVEGTETVSIEQHFSELAREMLQRAAEAAIQWGRREVDTEHLLYVLADNANVAAILESLGVKPADVRAYIEANTVKRDNAPPPGQERIGVSPRLKSALERAFIASRQLGHSYVGAEHLLIGLAEVPESFAGQLLARLGVQPQALRRQTLLAAGNEEKTAAPPPPSRTPNLDKHSRDLTALAREGGLDPVIGRSSEIETMVEVLARRRKNNPVLIGEPGVGKTAVVEGLAQRMVNGDVPESLRNKRLVELNVNSIVAGAKFRGEFEERVKQVVDEVLANHDSLVLFVDEVHTIVGAGQGGNEGGLDIANVFKPAMARGELNLIGATTLNEYQKYIEKDAALERRFQPVLIAEPSVVQTVNILRGLRDRLEAHHKVTIQDDAIVGAAELSDRYISGRFLPDKAIDLIDQAAARVNLSSTSRPAAVLELEAEITQLRREQDYAASRKQFDRAHSLDGEIAAKEQALRDETQAWQKSVGTNTSHVTVTNVAEIVARLTGIPVAQLTAEEKQRLLNMEERLHRRVIGQDEAVVAVSDAVRRSRAGLQARHRPTAVFLFLGPTGVGKTELAKALAEVVFGDEDAMLRFDMSEYMERHTVARLIGAPPGYVGYDEGGQLTERVRRKPYSVILLDEIEKAHPDVYNVLLQVFDDGRLTDGKGRMVDFSNTLIIATSNLGADVIAGQNRSGPGFLSDAGSVGVESGVMNVLRQHFRPEFLNRIDDIIIFKSLGRDETRHIVRLQLEHVSRLASSQDIELTFDDSIVDHLATEGYRPEFGARELRRQIQQQIENQLAKAMLNGDVKEGMQVVCRYDADRRLVTFEPVAGGKQPVAVVEPQTVK
ncbi:ATP-dependent Clp protease ATP-binding subunit [Paraburkholderia sp. PGU16]|jgi:ATP-dependent Clp protease ATP-binding subunit ClpC|uniref:ATPase n=1 Tax=Paraburkholderia largidicola TaxID=3014751 RepID=A0A7I8BPK2_9BURK|nr:ATP-dependent Clp protease ATP-binding subunit [Paraburkholderia sp. PGU16]BCF90552.1 ATPase [Paraburkholderia sp. PGU16]BEU24349.1 ATP-dependent Clp protease ATP-binding subunit [Paraburkholderia sp. 22B1P]GJH37918.1 AAA family ATPase [Paraburkholderia hospita]